MKKSDKAIKTTSYVAGFFVISAAMLLVLFLMMSVMGLIHPRKMRITLHTDSITKVYDGTPLQGSAPVISYGNLYPGHKLEIRNLPLYSEVGEYENIPDIFIVDAVGADVSNQYDITQDFGNLSIQPREITVSSYSKSKVYDTEPLTAGNVFLTGGMLAEGHTIVSEGGNSLLLPGSANVQPIYRIVSENGENVTDQYEITENFGALTVLPIQITISTESAKKLYDGQSLSATQWEQIGGKLLEGHAIDMHFTSAINDVGMIHNEANAKILDQNGNDVSALYEINYRFGTLEVTAMPLYITTMSAQKIYDGAPLRCEEWSLTNGELETGAMIVAQEQTVLNGIGTVDNTMRFRVVDQEGVDITYRYTISCSYGTLSVQPKTISIRTGSAKKTYDGTALSCDTFEIISGSFCEGEDIKLTCTSIVDVGYCENYVLSWFIYRVDADGTVIDVSNCYRIIFDFGVLEISAQ